MPTYYPDNIEVILTSDEYYPGITILDFDSIGFSAAINKQGNPVLFNKSMKQKIMNINGDAGAKKILEMNKEKALNIEINDQGIIKNFNTQDSFN